MTEPVTDDFFAELEAEIASATAKSKLKADATTLKRRANNMRLSSKDRAEAAAEFKSIQAIVEADQWIAVRCAAMFAEQTCDGCGSVHHNFLQYMQEEHKVKDPRTRRWVRVPLPNLLLEKETIIQPLLTHICSHCSEDHGFDVKRPSIRLLAREGSLTVSPLYVQGDINASPEES